MACLKRQGLGLGLSRDFSRTYLLSQSVDRSSAYLLRSIIPIWLALCRSWQISGNGDGIAEAGLRAGTRRGNRLDNGTRRGLETRRGEDWKAIIATISRIEKNFLDVDTYISIIGIFFPGRRYSLLPRDIPFSIPIIYTLLSIRERKILPSSYYTTPPLARLVPSRNKRPSLRKKIPEEGLK